MSSHLNKIKKANGLSVLADSSTDSTCDLESIYVRILYHETPVNVFLSVEELEQSTAQGFSAAIEEGL